RPRPGPARAARLRSARAGHHPARRPRARAAQRDPARPAAGAGRPGRAPPGADQPPRQRHRCHRAAGHDRGRRTRALLQRPGPADGDRRLRQRPRHVGGRDPARLRAVLHHQGARARHGPRARHRGPHHARARRPGRGRVEPGPGHDDARAPPPGGVMPRLLVVDDDTVTCRLLADVFKRDGYTVSGETDPQRALARAADEPVDLAILDVQMPEMDGLALLRGLRARLPDLPVVIMTAFASIDTAVQANPPGAVDCGALTETLLESELFGHVRGAFTGAIGDAPGLFAEADGGTIFLDEIGDVSPALQAKLLRVLQEHQIRPVGGSMWRAVDVRV